MARKNIVWLWSITAALGGFLFGFDTVVISGAEQAVQSRLGDGRRPARPRHLVGAVGHGVRLAGRVCPVRSLRPPAHAPRHRRPLHRVGRGVGVGVGGVSFCAFASSPPSAMGASSVATPLYITEIAPPANRGRLAGMFQFNIVVRHPGRLPLELAARRPWPQRLAADVGGGGVAGGALSRSLPGGDPESPRWLAGRAGGSRRRGPSSGSPTGSMPTRCSQP